MPSRQAQPSLTSGVSPASFPHQTLDCPVGGGSVDSNFPGFLVNPQEMPLTQIRRSQGVWKLQAATSSFSFFFFFSNFIYFLKPLPSLLPLSTNCPLHMPGSGPSTIFCPGVSPGHPVLKFVARRLVVGRASRARQALGPGLEGMRGGETGRSWDLQHRIKIRSPREGNGAANHSV